MAQSHPRTEVITAGSNPRLVLMVYAGTRIESLKTFKKALTASESFANLLVLEVLEVRGSRNDDARFVQSVGCLIFLARRGFSNAKRRYERKKNFRMNMGSTPISGISDK